MLLKIRALPGKGRDMNKQQRRKLMNCGLLSIAALCLSLTMPAPAAQAGCYADYKAKRDRPLRLHYGVMALPDVACRRPEAAARLIRRRLADNGWTLLTVLSTFDESGLGARRENAAGNFLRY